MKTQEEMNLLVPQKLAELERDYDITVLLAVESGSRAWGFASPDSDFDVRFLYVHKPEYYLQLQKRRDVIELPIDDTWDVCGWDLDKTLRLLWKSNPTLFEWINSPIVYKKTDFVEHFRSVAQQYFSVDRELYHYLSTAKRNYRVYLTDELVIPKKYFYVLRPLLACRWLLEQGTPPPVLFDTLIEAVLPTHLRPAVDRLLDLKIHAPEQHLILPIPEVQHWIEAEVKRLEQVIDTLPEDDDRSWDGLNAFFLSELGL